MEEETLVVLDASVIVKWFCEEKFTDIALKIRDKFFQGDIKIVIPELMFYEVSNAIRYNKAFSKEDKIEAIGDLFLLDFNVIPSDRNILSQAMEYALETYTTIYDNVYLSVSRLKKCPLITADEGYVKKINSRDVIFIRDWR